MQLTYEVTLTLIHLWSWQVTRSRCFILCCLALWMWVNKKTVHNTISLHLTESSITWQTHTYLQNATLYLVPTCRYISIFHFFPPQKLISAWSIICNWKYHWDCVCRILHSLQHCKAKVQILKHQHVYQAKNYVLFFLSPHHDRSTCKMPDNKLFLSS